MGFHEIDFHLRNHVNGIFALRNYCGGISRDKIFALRNHLGRDFKTLWNYHELFLGGTQSPSEASWQLSHRIETRLISSSFDGSSPARRV
jgi:hypothetical protein